MGFSLRPESNDTRDNFADELRDLIRKYIDGDGEMTIAEMVGILDTQKMQVQRRWLEIEQAEEPDENEDDAEP